MHVVFCLRNCHVLLSENFPSAVRPPTHHFKNFIHRFRCGIRASLGQNKERRDVTVLFRHESPGRKTLHFAMTRARAHTSSQTVVANVGGELTNPSRRRAGMFLRCRRRRSHALRTITFRTRRLRMDVSVTLFPSKL